MLKSNVSDTSWKLAKAETIWALKCALSNFSFKCNEDMPSIFKSMFTDSNIASSYSTSETKTKYVTQFGIAPYIIEHLKNYMKDTPFTFKFDENISKQVKKQYDGYVQYFSKTHKKIVNHYAGSLFLGHCVTPKT